MDIRVGHGYDVHRLVPGRNLVLGGVKVPWDKGLAGHSDADVLVHAVCDALLGAAGLGDLGRHFPDSDPAFEGISSLVLLRRVCVLIQEAGYRVSNIDCTLVAERPKLGRHKSAMAANIAGETGIGLDRVSVKATTTEGLGFTGRGEGMAAHAVVLIRQAGGGRPQHTDKS